MTTHKNSDIIEEKACSFQDLEVDEKYTVEQFEEITTGHGKAFLLTVTKIDESMSIKVWAPPSVKKYIEKENIEKIKKCFEFTVRKIFNGEHAGKYYAEIAGYNDSKIRERKIIKLNKK